MVNYKQKLFNATVISSIVILIILIVSLGKSNGIFFPQDEFGYWNNAAIILGIDWTEIASYSQNNYSYGYSLLLVPIMYFFKASPILMYRLAIILNAVIFIVYCGLLEKFIKRIFTDISSELATVFTLMGAFAPYLINYMHYTISETLLNLLFIILLNQVCSIKEKGLTISTVIPAFITSALMIFVHYRTIGIMVSFILVCLIKIKRDETVKPKVFGTGAAVFFCICIIAFILVLMSGRIRTANSINLYSILDMLIGIIGKYYYAVIATLGVGFFGFYSACKKRNDLVWLFVMIAFLFTAIIAAIYFLGSKRYDHLIYGRYNEMFLSVIMCLGMREILKNKPSFTNIVILLVSIGIVACILTLFMKKRTDTEYLGNYISGIEWMYFSEYPSAKWMYELPFYVCSVLIVIICVLVRIDAIKKYVPAILAVLMLCISLFSAHRNVYEYHIYDRSDYELKLQIDGLMGEGKELYFINSPYNDYINYMQFLMVDYPISVTEGLDEEAFNTPDDAVVLTYPNYEVPTQLFERYEHYNESGHFYLYYN